MSFVNRPQFSDYIRCEGSVRVTDNARRSNVSLCRFRISECRPLFKPGARPSTGWLPDPAPRSRKENPLTKIRFRSHLRPVILVMAALAVLAALAASASASRSVTQASTATRRPRP